MNLYEFLSNDGNSKIDILGLKPGDSFEDVHKTKIDAKAYLRQKGNESMRKGWMQFQAAFGRNSSNIFESEGLFEKLTPQAGSDYTTFYSYITPKSDPEQRLGWLIIIGREVASVAYCYHSISEKKLKYSYNFYEGTMKTKDSYADTRNLGEVRNDEVEKLIKQERHEDNSPIIGRHSFLHTHLLQGVTVERGKRPGEFYVIPGLSDGDKEAARRRQLEVIAIDKDGEDYAWPPP